MAEIKACCLMFVDRFDLEGVGEMPRPDTGRWVGVVHPSDHMPSTTVARR